MFDKPITEPVRRALALHAEPESERGSVIARMVCADDTLILVLADGRWLSWSADAGDEDSEASISADNLAPCKPWALFRAGLIDATEREVETQAQAQARKAMWDESERRQYEALRAKYEGHP